MIRTALSTLLILCFSGTAFAQSGDGGRCTRDALTIEGARVAVSFCAGTPKASLPGKPVTVTVTETFASPHSSFSRTASLDFLGGADVSRTIDDASLLPLGIHRSLHMTLAYAGGLVRLERAMLLPGALTVK